MAPWPPQFKRRIKATLTETAYDRTTITYGGLAEMLSSNIVRVEANDPELWNILDDLSRESDEQKGGMLSAVVVRSDSDRPGPGFYTLARELGRRGTDEEIWEGERAVVYRRWGGPARWVDTRRPRRRFGQRPRSP